MYDMIIVGAGPAGMAAAIYAKRAELKVLLLERATAGGQIINTYEVDNYPGIPGVDGFTLADKFSTHCDRLEVERKDGEVAKAEKDGAGWKLTLDGGEVLETKTVVIATGAANKKLGVPGEEELRGMGVSYCATCDGAFFRNKEVAVVGGGDVAVEDAIFLARLCKKVYIIHRRDEFRAAKSLVTALKACENVEFVYDSTVSSINGKNMTESVTVHNKKTGEDREIAINGIFIAVGIEPNSGTFEGVVEMENGWIKAGETCETSAPGIYAVGDVRTKQLRQVITAAADGANAVTSAERYLIELK
ncbi:MAG: thioredoxin-disulfide reductase [Lachnospiraceae bacterium]|nr:thioredoxin-disulfide reductase [Lachnospiraceae bacterium]